MDYVEQCQRKFKAPGVKFDYGINRFCRIKMTNQFGSVEAYVHGATVTGWTPKDQKQSVLWLSKKSWFEPGKPIRGGIPICFPWFGPHATDKTLPGHGCVRYRDWTVSNVLNLSNGETQLVLTFNSDVGTRRLWQHDFFAEYVVTLGESLVVSLMIKNTGTIPFTFEEALHSYFAVGDVKKVSVHSLKDAQYIDKVRDGKSFVDNEEPLMFAGETDRVYTNHTKPVILQDSVFGRSVEVTKSGSDSTIVWTPFPEKSKRMLDFGDSEWTEMVCIESGNVMDNCITLQPGERHTIEVVYNVK